MHTILSVCSFAGLNGRFVAVSKSLADIHTRIPLEKFHANLDDGRLPERTNGTVSKTVEVFWASVGSNPTPSASTSTGVHGDPRKAC
jgi:hypothetical protein